MMASTEGGVLCSASLAARTRRSEGGFTLIELMIVVAVVAILAAIAYPSYQEAVRKSKRGQVKADMVEYAQMAERWFSVRGSYDDFELPHSVSPREEDGGTPRYELDIDAEGNEFVITAEAVGDQEKDRCGDLLLNQAGVKENTRGELSDCW